jgi:hypothetical protein
MATDDDYVLLMPDEIEALPVMREWKRLTLEIHRSTQDTTWVVRFLRNFADQLEANLDEEVDESA